MKISDFSLNGKIVPGFEVLVGDPEVNDLLIYGIYISMTNLYDQFDIFRTSGELVFIKVPKNIYGYHIKNLGSC